MAVNRKEFFFTSSVGNCEIHAVSWKPKGKKVKAVFQMAHGMAEHLERYEQFAVFMAENGYAVYMNDHIGHGKSINFRYPLGYFGMKNTQGEVFVKDCKLLMDIAMAENPGVPVVFFGHSMGSLVARKFTMYYGDKLTGSVFCGTVGPNPASPIAEKICDVLAKYVGIVADGKLVDSLAFGTYNKRTQNRTKFDWLTTDKSIVDKYIADPLCGFYFSNRGYKDMLSLLTFVNSNACAEMMPRDRNILLVSGEEDPCGEYGSGVKKVADKLEAAGMNVQLKLYPDARHEILNEFCREEVMNDILSWTDDKVENAG